MSNGTTKREVVRNLNRLDHLLRQGGHQFLYDGMVKNSVSLCEESFGDVYRMVKEGKITVHSPSL